MLDCFGDFIIVQPWIETTNIGLCSRCSADVQTNAVLSRLARKQLCRMFILVVALVQGVLTHSRLGMTLGPSPRS